MARKKKDDSGGLTGNEWLGTYSDCVTLLLTFFVLLYSMSSVDAEKVQSISKAFSLMSGQAGDTFLEYDLYEGSQPIIGGEGKSEEILDTNEGESQTMYKDVKDFLDENELNSIVSISEDERGVILKVKDNILFESGKATLIENSQEILNKINALISTLPNSIIIEGHTDNVPISNSNYPSNWELSTQRAVNVVRYFVEKNNQNPSRFSAAGYGEFKPDVENNSDENRARNRRVNILIVANNKE